MKRTNQTQMTLKESFDLALLESAEEPDWLKAIHEQNRAIEVFLESQEVIRELRRD